MYTWIQTYAWWNIVREKVKVRMTSLALRICNLYFLKLVNCNLRSSRNAHEWRPAVIRMWDLLAGGLKIWNSKFSNVQDMCMSDNLWSSECGVWVWEFGMTPLPVSSSIRFCFCLDLHLYLCICQLHLWACICTHFLFRKCQLHLLYSFCTNQDRE